MTSLFTYLHDNWEFIAWLLGIAGSIAGWPPGRRFVIRMAKAFWRNLNAGAAMDRQEAALKLITEKLDRVMKEVLPNGGGSMKDSLGRMEKMQGRSDSFRRHDFWTKGKPAMELDEEGHVDLVSEAACRLFHVVNPDELCRRSWLRFLEGRHTEEFLRAFVETAKTDSAFSFTIALRDVDGQPRGRWEFRAIRIEPDVEVFLPAAPGGSPSVLRKKLYSGYWNPMDETAKDIADRNRWAN